jgi:hypothetical protein
LAVAEAGGTDGRRVEIQLQDRRGSVRRHDSDELQNHRRVQCILPELEHDILTFAIHAFQPDPIRQQTDPRILCEISHDPGTAP